MKNETNQTTNAILTNAQRELIDNFCKIGKRAKPFGNLYAKKYVGNNNVALEFLNLLKDETQGKYIGKSASNIRKWKMLLVSMGN